ncbi:Major Facilitator Superfamily protein [Asanoa hainanensis]|uniref:Major Facilitator Superfamily protein n=1 Tax=Asanoa hainanensis TaxID=560556 RepID=A0A239NJ69_9ACTN|nr:MFS transporter [Asanoa hainanensis]SNT54513.1 Major Facilitator Superfamily protein [Asanoa hainanensis]
MTLTAPPPAMAPARSTTSLVFVLLGLGAGTFATLQSLISPVLPVIRHDLGATQAGVSWVLIAWLLSASVATPILGRIADLIGKHRALLIVLGAIAAGSLVSALAPNLGVLIGGRIVQGLGGAIFPIVFGIIRDEYAAHRVPRAIGAMSSVIAVGGGLGTVLAGPITAAFGWRALFGIPLVLVLAVGALAWKYVPASPVRGGGRVNWPAATLLAGWLVALLLPVSIGARWGWLSAPTVGLFLVAAIAFTAWVLVETRSSNPMIDMRMLRHRPVWTTNLVALLFGAAMFSVVTFLPQFIQTPRAAGYGFGSSVTVAGFLVLPMLVTMAVGGMLSGPIHRVVGFRSQLAYGSAFLGVGATGFALLHDAPWQVSLAAAVFGLGLGLAYAAMTSVIVHSVSPSATGAATGMNANIRNIGGAIGTAVVSAVVTGTIASNGLPTSTGYTVAFLTIAATAVVAVVVSLLVPRATR